MCHLQKGAGNDSGMSCHIERRNAESKQHIPANADPNRTHLNRELIMFPDGVTCRTQAIQHRLANAGLNRKVGKNQVQAVRIILTGTHEQMMEIEKSGRLDAWMRSNLDWLNETFGKDNVVSCVLHMDEKTPHLHATVVPIVIEERKRRKREGNQKYQTKLGPRLSVNDMMARWRLRQYQDTYAKAMKPFGLERGIVGSTANHKSQQQHNAEVIREQEAKIVALEENIETLLADVAEAKCRYSETVAANEEAKESITAQFQSWFGFGELAKARKANKEKDAEIARLQKELTDEKAKLASMKMQFDQQLKEVRNGHQQEMDVAVKRAETAEKERDCLQAKVENQRKQIQEQDRQLHPERYRLSSGATLEGLKFLGNYGIISGMMIWTKVGDIEHRATSHNLSPANLRAYQSEKLTIEELINTVFTPEEQINDEQSQLLAATLNLFSGGPGNPHIGTGSGGSSSDLRWDGKAPNDRNRPKRR